MSSNLGSEIAKGVKREVEAKITEAKNSVKAMVESRIKEQKEKLEYINLSSWLNGLYVAKAIQACFSKDEQYPQKPIDFNADEKVNTKDAADDFKEYVSAFNDQFRKKNGTSIERHESDGEIDGSGQT